MRKFKLLSSAMLFIFLVACGKYSLKIDGLDEAIDFINEQNANVYFYRSINNDLDNIKNKSIFTNLNNVNPKTGINFIVYNLYSEKNNLTSSSLDTILSLLNYNKNVICFYGTIDYEFLKGNEKLYNANVKESSSYCLSNIRYLLATEHAFSISGTNGGSIDSDIETANVNMARTVVNYIITINREV